MRLFLAFIVLPLLWAHAISETVVGWFNGRIHSAFDFVGRSHLRSANLRLGIIAISLGICVFVLILGVPIAILKGAWTGLETFWADLEDLIDDIVSGWRQAAPKVQPSAPSPAAAVPEGTSAQASA
jgi:hypothetical protein